MENENAENGHGQKAEAAQPGIPNVDPTAANAQIEQLTSAANLASERVRQAESNFKKTKDQVLAMLGLSPSSEHGIAISMQLDTCFTYGQIYGESSESVMSNREQAKMLARMLEDIEMTTRLSRERDEKQEKRDVEHKAREEKALAFAERQVKALEVIARMATSSPR